ncbi:MAG TPA: MG2 domain-containing protein [Ferruginibacter sp.]|nr:MG2 domain-containing protein [Ferruginibacter sp.]
MFPSHRCSQKVQKFIFCSLLFIAICSSCSKKENNWISVDPAYAKYVEAYTTGVVSKTSRIRIVLAQNAGTTHVTGQPVDDRLFEFSPAINGKAIWMDARTIEFIPEKNLEPDKLYEVRFNLGKVTAVPEKFKTLHFNFQTIRPAFKVSNNGLRSTGVNDKMNLSGKVTTADSEQSIAIEKILKATYQGGQYKITWQHTGDGKSHDFNIENIQRNKAGYLLQLKWDGSSMDIQNKGIQNLSVPAVGEFKVLQVMPVNEAQQYASIQFSDPVAIGQDLTGLISFSNQENPAYTINGSEIKMFGSNALEGNYNIIVYTGIKNTWGSTLMNTYSANVVFENLKPSVKIQGKGNILPNSGKLVLPFEAINLSAVDISIIKIFENNIPQFLQENDLAGNSELRRVAIPVVQQTLRLDNDKTLDLHLKQRFTLDIDKFLKTEPGAIYRVTIGFRPAYSLYTAGNIETVTTGEKNSDDEEEESYESNNEIIDEDINENFWSRYDTYYPYGYSWRKRDDPTSKSYYNKDRWATRNIIASNIGLTAKRGSDHSLQVAVTDIITTAPMNGVELLVMNYQQQIIGKASSASDGFATIELKENPFLLIAKKQGERGYLKLDDGSSLPLSRFDISGEEIKNGIKGFIFGERGVWRPGDSLFLNCIVEDQSGKLPDGHPADFSLFTPDGQLYRHAILNGLDGFYVFKTNTEPSAPTGNWLVKAKLGGATFEKRIKVETVMPNRLKINLDFGNEGILRNGINPGILQAKWLFGSPGKNLKAKIDASLYSGKTTFPDFTGYTFDNPAASYSTQTKVMFEGSLNEEGTARIQTDFETQDAPGMLTANLLTKVFEPGGSFSIDYMSIPYSPFNSYAGIKMPAGEEPFDFLLTGKQHTIQLVNVDSHGNLVRGAGQLEVQFYRIEWRWWWDESGDNLSNFTQNAYNKLLKKENITLTNGKGQWKFRTGADEWGRFLVLVKDLKSGHTTGKAFYVDEPGWQSRAGNEEQSAAAMLSFTSDKEKYNVGDEVKLTIPSSKGGRMLISLENGSHVIRSFWKESIQGQTTVSFTAEKGMSPNIYATVSLLQPHAQTMNDLPIRMYGSIPVLIEDKNTFLKPLLSMPSTIRPEQTITLSVSENQGKEMTYCIAVVDEGLLDLTRFKTPDPHAAFYAREALGVKSFDVFDYVIGAWGSDFARILTIGGDTDEGPGKQKTANRFKPVVKFIGPFHLNKKQRQSHNLQLPPYIGSVRVMVIAAHKGSYGSAEKTVAVKKPLMVLATMPRVLAPGETLRLPVTVFAMDNSIRQVNVSVLPNAMLSIEGPNKQQLTFSSTGEQLAYFDLKVNNNTGIGKLRVNINSGSENAFDQVELEIRNPNPVITNIRQATIGSNQQWQATVLPIGIASEGTAVLEISSIPPMNLQKRLSYLIDYPHGCIEQTTSAAFPQLVLNQLTDLNEFQKATVDRNIKAAISRIQQFQRPEGGFSYWPGMRETDDWGSSYAGHFLIESQNNGYFVNENTLQQWKNFQRQKANSWAPSTTNFYGGDLAQAYRLYTLALFKSAELGAMNRLKEFKYLSAEAKWRLAAAYQLTGQNNTALDLISGLPVDFPKRDFWGFTYGSDVRDQAMVLETLALMGKRNKAVELLATIAAELNNETWYSTQTTAYALIAIAKFCGRNPAPEKIAGQVIINGKKTDVASKSYMIQVPVKLQPGNNAVAMINNGSNNLFTKLVIQGRPLTGDSIKVVNNTGLLDMKVEYITQDGKPLPVNSLAQGTDFIARVVIKNTGKRGIYTQMALSQVFPSGWEILNARMMDGEGKFKSSPLTYQDIRDDRVYTYFDIRQNEVLTYYIRLNATYPGRYFLPATSCGAMYDNRITAALTGKWVQTLKQ